MSEKRKLPDRRAAAVKCIEILKNIDTLLDALDAADTYHGDLVQNFETFERKRQTTRLITMLETERRDENLSHKLRTAEEE